MRETMNPYDCERFRDELAEHLDDAISPAAAEHLSGCDACRDLRHDARLAARAVSRAGADYAPTDPDALARSVLAALRPVAFRPGRNSLVALAGITATGHEGRPRHNPAVP